MLYKTCAVVITLCVMVVTVFTMVTFSVPLIGGVGSDSALSHCVDEGSIVVVPIYGDIAWGVSETGVSVYGADIAAIVREVADSDWYSGVVFDIDSPGGYPVASFRLAEYIYDLPVPTAAVIGDMGLSGGYAIAAATDEIFVHPISDVGSIGVTASYIDESEANEREGYRYESLSTGLYKDVGDPARGLNDEERAFMMDNLRNTHGYFVQKIIDYRGLDAVTALMLADGKWWPGTTAIELGLADQEGNLESAIAYIREQSGEQGVVCTVAVY